MSVTVAVSARKTQTLSTDTMKKEEEYHVSKDH